MRRAATDFEQKAGALSWGQDTESDDLIKAEGRLVAAIEQEVQRYLWPPELRPADLNDSPERVNCRRFRIRNRRPGS